MTGKTELRSVIEFVEEYATEYELTNPKGVRAILDKIQEDLEVLEILKYLIPSIEKTFNLKRFNESGMLGTIIKDYFIDNDITGKVKEWLENDRQRGIK